VSETDINTGALSSGGGNEAPAPTSVDTRTDHAQDRAGGEATPRSQERQQSAPDRGAPDRGTPPRTGKTLRQTLSDAFKEHQAIANAKEAADRAAGPPPPREPETAPSGKSVGEHVKAALDQSRMETEATPGRDARGRFAKKDGGAVEQPPAVSPVNVEPQKPPEKDFSGRTPPGRWKDLAAIAAWNALPDAVKVEVMAAEQEMDQGGRKWSEERHAYDEAFNPILEGEMKKANITRPQFVKRAADWHFALADANKDKATSVWLQAAPQYGIQYPEILYDLNGKAMIFRPGTLRQLAMALTKNGQLPGQQPTQQQAPPARPQDPRIDQLSQQVTQLTQAHTQMTEAQQAENDRTVDALFTEFTN
jgi:hypothetical protein